LFTLNQNGNVMTAIHPQYITDTAGQKLVVLPIQEFDAMIEELEELEDIKMYDNAKKEDDGERVLFSDYLKNRKAKNV
jgi:PHD/YefM family antitoxin component YafN of YafNO toxin-antitoxin module